jgi:hypothetical protein
MDHEQRDHRPTARQILHAATGDRDAEAQALVDQDPDVSEEDAVVAVQRAHGEAGRDAPQTDSDIAHTEDAEDVRRERQR